MGTTMSACGVVTVHLVNDDRFWPPECAREAGEILMVMERISPAPVDETDVGIGEPQAATGDHEFGVLSDERPVGAAVPGVDSTAEDARQDHLRGAETVSARGSCVPAERVEETMHLTLRIVEWSQEVSANSS